MKESAPGTRKTEKTKQKPQNRFSQSSTRTRRRRANRKCPREPSETVVSSGLQKETKKRYGTVPGFLPRTLFALSLNGESRSKLGLWPIERGHHWSRRRSLPYFHLAGTTAVLLVALLISGCIAPLSQARATATLSGQIYTNSLSLVRSHVTPRDCTMARMRILVAHSFGLWRGHWLSNCNRDREGHHRIRLASVLRQCPRARTALCVPRLQRHVYRIQSRLHGFDFE